MALPVRRLNGGSDSAAQPYRVERWDPLTELDQLNRRLSGYLDFWRQGPSLLDGPFTPTADVEEIADAYLVDIELPGVRQQDLDIEVAGRRLTVRGERKEKERVGIVRRRERTAGEFHYEVTLPGTIAEDGIDASLDEGVLTVRVPKPTSQRRRASTPTEPPRPCDEAEEAEPRCAP
jgi:HSP20 family protein